MFAADQYLSDRDDHDLIQISTGCRDEDRRLLALGSVDLLRANLAHLREALTERNILAGAAPLSEDIELADYALRELAQYLGHDPSGTLNRMSSQIFAGFLWRQFHSLRETAEGFGAPPIAAT